MRRVLTHRTVGIAALFTFFAGRAEAVAATAARKNLRSAAISLDGLERECFCYAPVEAKEKPTPVVFVFRGDGGSMRRAVRSFAIYQHWLEAISIYLQGVPTAGPLADPEGEKAGWHRRYAGYGGRDLNFFDAVLERLKSDCRVDAKRIYSTGQSNGGGSTYLLWAVPCDIFAALAPSSAASAGSAGKRPWLKPVPVMHITGEADSLVKYHWQVAAMNADRKLKGCQAVAKPRHGHPRRLLYESPTGALFVSIIHPGGHKFFDEAPALIVAFFKEH